MSTIHPGGKNAAGLPTATVPDRDTDAVQVIPEEWLDEATQIPISDAEREFVPVLWTVEHELADDPEILAGRRPGRGEVWQIAVMYVSSDGRERVDKSFPARVIESTRGVLVSPERLDGRVGVDGEVVTPARRPVTHQIARALEELHGISDVDVEEDSGVSGGDA